MPPQIDKIKSLDENAQSISDNQHENLFNIRKYLLALVLIQWFAFVIALAVGIYSITIGNTIDISSGIKSLIPIIILVLYYTFGLLVAYKEHRIGLLIFASIGIVLCIAVCLVLGYLLLAIIALDVGFGNTGQAREMVVFIGILLLIVVIVAIITLKLSFDLARSIKRTEYSTV